MPFIQCDRATSAIYHVYCLIALWRYSQQTRDMKPMLVCCWANFVNGGRTLTQHWLHVSCLLGYSNHPSAHCFHNVSPLCATWTNIVPTLYVFGFVLVLTLFSSLTLRMRFTQSGSSSCVPLRRLQASRMSCLRLRQATRTSSSRTRNAHTTKMSCQRDHTFRLIVLILL